MCGSTPLDYKFDVFPFEVTARGGVRAHSSATVLSHTYKSIHNSRFRAKPQLPARLHNSKSGSAVNQYSSCGFRRKTIKVSRARERGGDTLKNVWQEKAGRRRAAWRKIWLGIYFERGAGRRCAAFLNSN
jgi:hypothetical protein